MTYDGIDRLKSAASFWGSGSYTYDVLGNLKTKNEGSQAMTYNYNRSLNRLTSITGANALSFSYDTRGSVTNNGAQGFTYNLAGNMVSSTSPTIAYGYDAHKRRVKKTEGGQTTYSLYINCPKCATVVLPGQAIFASVPYDLFSLPDSLTHSTKRLEYSATAFNCNERNVVKVNLD